MSATSPAVSEVLVLCYHSLSPTWSAPTNVTPERFERQLEWLERAGYSSATLSEALIDPPAPRTVALTFDDAHRSVLDGGLAAIRDRGMVATVFAATDYVDSGDPMAWSGYDIWAGTDDEEELTPMSWDDLGDLVEAGWEVGSHTLSHPRLPRVADDGRLAAELSESRRRCEEVLRRPCPTLAYPYGLHDARVRRAAAEAGYTVAVTMPQSAATPLPLAWPRVGVYRDDDVSRLRTRVWRRSLPFRSRLGARALEAALSLRGGG